MKERETPSVESGAAVGSSALVRRCAFSLLARGDSLNGWAFKMHSKAIFERREDAEAHMPAFSTACCDRQHFECADEKTLKVEILERDLYSPNAEWSDGEQPPQRNK